MTSLDEAIKGLDKGLVAVIKSIAKTAAEVEARFSMHRGALKSQNIYGEQQQELDVISNEIITKDLIATGVVKAVVSEETAEPVMGPGEYVVTIDPLDGSSNIKSNNSFGTIVGVHKEKDILTQGKNQVAAFYILYGPLTTMTLATKGRVSEFVQNPKTKEFFLDRDNVKLPQPGVLIGTGGNNQGWDPKFTKFVQGKLDKKLKLRYGGAFVGDINQILYYGGLFAYPNTAKKEHGKLRLVIECNPMAFIVTQAGGTASDGKGKILDLKPTEYDQRTPVYIGNRDIVAEVEKALR